jgi:hypothetical protein
MICLGSFKKMTGRHFKFGDDQFRPRPAVFIICHLIIRRYTQLSYWQRREISHKRISKQTNKTVSIFWPLLWKVKQTRELFKLSAWSEENFIFSLVLHLGAVKLPPEGRSGWCVRVCVCVCVCVVGWISKFRRIDYFTETITAWGEVSSRRSWSWILWQLYNFTSTSSRNEGWSVDLNTRNRTILWTAISLSEVAELHKISRNEVTTIHELLKWIRRKMRERNSRKKEAVKEKFLPRFFSQGLQGK